MREIRLFLPLTTAAAAEKRRATGWLPFMYHNEAKHVPPEQARTFSATNLQSSHPEASFRPGLCLRL
jgi:hypothetical protein